MMPRSGNLKSKLQMRYFIDIEAVVAICHRLFDNGKNDSICIYSSIIQTILLHSKHCKHQFRILQCIIFVYKN